MSDRVSNNPVEELRTRHEALAAEVAELRRAATSRRRRLPVPRWSRRPATSVIVTIVLLLTAPLVLATDRFADVSETNQPFHHDDISDLADAGITAGCGVDPETDLPLYCPDSAVTRAQMASFMRRGLGQANFVHTFALDFAATTFTNVASVEIEVPGAAANTSPTNGFVLVTATAPLGDGTAGCPCRINVQVSDGSQASWFSGAEAPVGTVYNSVSVTYLFPVSAAPGTTKTYHMQARRASGTGSVTVYADLAAVWIPFSAAPGGASAASGDAPAQPVQSAP